MVNLDEEEDQPLLPSHNGLIRRGAGSSHGGNSDCFKKYILYLYLLFHSFFLFFDDIAASSSFGKPKRYISSSNLVGAVNTAVEKTGSISVSCR